MTRMGKLFFIFFFFLLTACKQEIPDPKALAANDGSIQVNKEMTVHHFVKENAVYIECIVPSVSFFRGGKGNNEGKVVLYINGKHYAEYDTAAFVVKGLNKGVHQIKIDVVNLENKSYDMSEEFTVTIQ